MLDGQGARPGPRHSHTRVLRRGEAKGRALLVAVLLVLWSAVGQAGTPNAWSTVALSGDVPGRGAPLQPGSCTMLWRRALSMS